MTLTVLSLNTAIDRTLMVPGLRPGGVYRTQSVHVDAGGKGLNVARVLRQLGEPVRVVGFLGGAAIPLIRERCAAMGIEQHWVEIEGETRTCLILLDGEGGAPTVINESGPSVTETEVETLRRTLPAVIRSGEILALSGSAPPGVPRGFIREIVSALQSGGVRVLIDTSEVRLGEALEASPWAVTPTVDEAAGVLGPRPPEDLASALAARAEHVVLTEGARGAVYAGGGEVWQLVPPPVTALNPIASGDALAAGFISRMARGDTGLQSARFGVACGTANAAQNAAGIPSMAEVEEIASQVTMARVGEVGRGEVRPTPRI